MRRRGERSVFFPWERRRGLLGALSRARAGLVVGGLLVVSAIAWMYAREEHAAGVRATQVALTAAHLGVSAFRADHGGACPKDLSEVVALGYTRQPLIDGWGRPLRMTCPGRRDARGFEIASDGPDGEPGGLDRVE